MEFRSRLLAVVAGSGTAIVLGAVVVLLARGRGLEVLYGLWILQNGPTAVLLLWMAFLVIRRLPRHGAGRILLVIGLVQIAHVVVATVADLRLVAAGFEQPLLGDHGLVPDRLPLDASVPLWVMNWLWVPAALLVVLLPLVFPDGRLPGPRWRWTVPLAALAGGLLLAGTVIDGWPTAGAEPPPVVAVLLLAGGVCTLGLAVAGVVAFATRWRRAGRDAPRFVFVGGAAAAFALLLVVAYPWPTIWTPLVHLGLAALVVVYAFAIARYRLHDVEPVLGRGAVAATLSVLLAAVYLAIVVGVGRLIGAGVDDPVLPLVAAGLVALLVEPARRAVRRIVDRVLFRRSADPADVLSRLAGRAAEEGPGVIDEVAELLVRSTGASRVEVLVAGVDDAGASAGRARADPVRSRAEIAHGEERFGEIRLRATAASDLVPGAGALLGDVARLLGVVLHARGLARRLLEAHERARRELERDIHDGAQARLVALRLQIAALRVQGAADAADLDRLGAELDAAVRELRELARGLQPPVLEQSGLVAALRTHVRDLPLPVRVRGGAGRYPRAIEGAAYFSCLEAVQNSLRHAHATELTIDIAAEAGELRLEVRDDGHGFDTSRPAAGTARGLENMSDRVAALGGRIRVRSAPGEGTSVRLAIPVQPSAAR